MIETKICNAKYCLHPSREIPLGEEVRGRRGQYYHADCFHTMQCFLEAKSLYCDYDETVHIPQLVSVLKSIFYIKRFDPDFALYAIKKALSRKTVKHPCGLHYVVRDNVLREQFEQSRLKVVRTETESEEENINPLGMGSKDKYTPSEFKGFGAIFKGGR